MVSAKALLVTHLIAFLGGFVAGKTIDADELAEYRRVHESATSRWKRRAIYASVGLASVSLLLLITTTTSSSSSKTKAAIKK
eukprot:CAMPEP_0118704278 /NCGR_PEP_ID=MMETSP0800-20121206/19128_1 /TAXON_ID=210618 ORGANISM="Striatella unipunctata, Strain CCMP2910" /NCGR_SAMPLE_ID=MMETSP0800 /ASSEMBLY_ACC=CAM_ASM_000638 /LENGTH=81 /DNA_ID=CAMNT_0006606113 /DNA_START=155 /DNA_END=403 /DNA_ORIENTATION=+